MSRPAVRQLALLGSLALSACGFVSLESVSSDAGAAGLDVLSEDASADDVLGDAFEGLDTGAPDAPAPGCTLTRREGLVSSRAHSCALRGTELFCWGANASGQVGGSDAMVNAPRQVPGEWLSVEASSDFTCARAADGLYCWGANEFGQLGNGDIETSNLPTRVSLDSCVTRFSVGFDFACAVDDADGLWCWGLNDEDQLAQPGRPESSSTPLRVSGEWLDVATAQGHALALDTERRIWVWGRNTNFQLGLGEDIGVRVLTPTQLDESLWEQIGAAQSSSCGVRADGTAFRWGENAMGQLGVGDEEVRSTPTELSARPFSVLSIANFHGCGIIEGSLFCWGRGIEGQLGTGDLEARDLPTPVSGFDDWVDVDVGRLHTCATRADATVWCTGANGEGQLGLGDFDRRQEFEQVAF